MRRQSQEGRRPRGLLPRGRRGIWRGGVEATAGLAVGLGAVIDGFAFEAGEVGNDLERVSQVAAILTGYSRCQCFFHLLLVTEPALLNWLILTSNTEIMLRSGSRQARPPNGSLPKRKFISSSPSFL